METHGLPKWAIPAAIAGIVLLLVLRGKGGTATTAGASAATDPLHAAAQQLALQNQQADNARTQALANQRTQETYTTEQVSYYQNLIKNPLVACPNGGLPRLIPSGNGLQWGCVQHTSKPFLQTVIDTTRQAIGLAGSV